MFLTEMRKHAWVGLTTSQVKDWCLVVGRAAFYMLFICDFLNRFRVL
jgi:hypothetical protein